MIYQVIISDIQKYLESSLSTKNWVNFTVQGIVSNLINLILVIAFVAFLFLLLLGGIQWITSGGDKELLAKAKGKLTSAIVGIIIVISAWAILSLVRNFFGLTGGGTPPTGCTPPREKLAMTAEGDAVAISVVKKAIPATVVPAEVGRGVLSKMEPAPVD